MSDVTTMQRIRTENDPFEAFALSQGIAVGDMLFISGQAALDEQGNMVGGDDFRAQAHCAFSNLEKVLKAANSDMDDVVKVSIFVTDISRFADVVELRREFFKAPYPADSIFEVKSLALPGLQFEIEAIAVRGSGQAKKTI